MSAPTINNHVSSLVTSKSLQQQYSGGAQVPDFRGFLAADVESPRLPIEIPTPLPRPIPSPNLPIVKVPVEPSPGRPPVDEKPVPLPIVKRPLPPWNDKRMMRVLRKIRFSCRTCHQKVRLRPMPPVKKPPAEIPPVPLPIVKEPGPIRPPRPPVVVDAPQRLQDFLRLS